MPDPALLKAIADGSIKAVKKEMIQDPINAVAYPMHQYLRTMMLGTTVLQHDNRHLARWRNVPPKVLRAPNYNTHFEIQGMTTLQGARYLEGLAGTTRNPIGVLNFASATRPGGGWRAGASAQEESIVRSSTLFVSLESQKAKPFYDWHKETRNDPFYSHMMIYSPHVLLFRDDHGQWLKPTVVDVLTSPAVNAREVRKLPQYHPGMEQQIENEMRERMARILATFEYRDAKHLVLGSFGTGVFQNDVGMVARIWRELLFEPQARFKLSFDRVLFAIPDGRTRQAFRDAFLGQDAQVVQGGPQGGVAFG